MSKKSHLSEICLLAILVVIVGLIRVYYGDPSGPMIVWKSEFTLKDTLVNVAELAKLPRAQLEHEHRDALYQMEEMGLLENPNEIHRPLRRPAQSPAT